MLGEYINIGYWTIVEFRFLRKWGTLKVVIGDEAFTALRWQHYSVLGCVIDGKFHVISSLFQITVAENFPKPFITNIISTTFFPFFEHVSSHDFNS